MDSAPSSVTSRLGPSYWKLWGAATISNIGDGIRFAALPLLAATITRDPLLVAGTVVAAQLPWLLVALVSGALVDRLDRRVVMWTANAFRCLVMVGLTVAVVQDAGLPIIYVLVFLLGVAETFFDSASGALVPELVNEENLERANGRLEATIVFSQTFAGPPIGAALFTVAASLAFIVDAASFAVAAGLIFTIRGNFTPEREEDSTFGNLTADIVEGVRWVWRHAILRRILIIAAIVNGVVYATFAIRVLFATEHLNLGAAGFGLLLAAEGAGAILGALVASRVSHRLGRGPSLLVTLALQVLSMLAFGLTSNAIVGGLALAAGGVAVGLWNVIAISIAQAVTPGERMGRVFSAVNTISWGTIPIGAAIGGVVSGAFGLRSPYLVGAGLLLAAVVVGTTLSKEVRKWSDHEKDPGGDTPRGQVGPREHHQQPIEPPNVP